MPFTGAPCVPRSVGLARAALRRVHGASICANQADSPGKHSGHGVRKPTEDLNVGGARRMPVTISVTA
jgi:hypothetical protein